MNIDGYFKKIDKGVKPEERFMLGLVDEINDEDWKKTIEHMETLGQADINRLINYFGEKRQQKPNPQQT